MNKIILFILGMGISFYMFMMDFFLVMATSPVPSPKFSYTPKHAPAHIPNPTDDFYAPVPSNYYSPALSPVEKSNISTIVESSEFQEIIVDMFEEGATYGIAQKGYTVNSSVYQVSPEATATGAIYGGYQILYSLYGDSPDYQAFIQPYKDMDNGGIFGEAWGQVFPVNTIYGTFTYGEMRLDAAIDSVTGEIKACVLSFQSGFEKTVDKFISKIKNNFYCPVKPDFECDEYGLTYPSRVKAYALSGPNKANEYTRAAFIWFEDAVLDVLPESTYCCFLKEGPINDYFRRTLYIVTGERLPDSLTYRGFNVWSNSKVIMGEYLPDIEGKANFATFTYRGEAGGYYFYRLTSDVLSHYSNYPAMDYYYPYISFHMSEKDFIAYYVDNAGKLSVGGVLLSPVQPSVKGFPQPGNVYNPSDMQEYNNNQREKIEECPVISPQSEPYPGSVPAPAVEPLPGTHSLPLIITDPATGEMTVKPVELPEPAPGGDKVIDPDTGQEVTDKNLSPYMFDLSKKFPFCVPFDLIECVKILKQKPVAPSFEWTLRVDMINFEYTFKIDLACFEPAAKVCRIMFTLLFIVSLVLATRGMIRG